MDLGVGDSSSLIRPILKIHMSLNSKDFRHFAGVLAFSRRRTTAPKERCRNCSKAAEHQSSRRDHRVATGARHVQLFFWILHHFDSTGSHVTYIFPPQPAVAKSHRYTAELEPFEPPPQLQTNGWGFTTGGGDGASSSADGGSPRTPRPGRIRSKRGSTAIRIGPW